MNPFEPAILASPADRSQQIAYAEWLADRDPHYSAALLADDFPATAWAAVACGHGLRETWVLVEAIRRAGEMTFDQPGHRKGRCCCHPSALPLHQE